MAPNFAKHYAEALRAGYAALGLPVPDLANMTRAQMLRELQKLEQLVARGGAAPETQRALELLRGLLDLDPSQIPNGWIGAELMFETPGGLRRELPRLIPPQRLRGW